jgi:hypothetical protein
MKRRELLFSAAAAAVMVVTGAGEALARRDDHGGHDGRGRGGHDGRGGHGDDWRGHGDRDWHDGRGWRSDHDRYWRSHYGRRGFIGHDRVFRQLRRHHYNRWVGDPYWFRGRYVIRTYNRFGRVIFVEIDPYTGDFIGEVMF